MAWVHGWDRFRLPWLTYTIIYDTLSCIWQLPQHRAQRSADQSFLNPASTFFSGSDCLSSISHVHNLYFLYVDNSDFLSQIEAISKKIHISAPFMFSWQQRALWSPETPSQIQFNLRVLYELRVCPLSLTKRKNHLVKAALISLVLNWAEFLLGTEGRFKLSNVAWNHEKQSHEI